MLNFLFLSLSLSLSLSLPAHSSSPWQLGRWRKKRENEERSKDGWPEGKKAGTEGEKNDRVRKGRRQGGTEEEEENEE